MIDWFLDGTLLRSRLSEHRTGTEKTECDWRCRPTVPSPFLPSVACSACPSGDRTLRVLGPPRGTRAQATAPQAKHLTPQRAMLSWGHCQRQPAPAATSSGSSASTPRLVGGPGTVANGAQLSWHPPTNVSPVETRPGRTRPTRALVSAEGAATAAEHDQVGRSRRKPWPRGKQRGATRSDKADESPGPWEAVGTRPSRHGSRRKPWPLRSGRTRHDQVGQRRRKPWPREKQRDATRSDGADESPGPWEAVRAHSCS